MINIAIKLATSITYTADGSQTNFSIPFDYLRPSFVHVAVNDAEVSEGFTVSNRGIMFDTAPAKDALVKIYRKTPTSRLVSWADASILKAIDMTIAEVQQLHILEEASDWSKTNSIVLDEEGNTWQGRNCRMSNIADPTEAQDVVTKHYLDNEEGSFTATMNALKTKTEEAASTAETNAKQARFNAEKANSAAVSAERDAATALKSANNAKTSETNVNASKEAAQSAATTASNFASDARNSAGEAKTYKDNAKTYMDNAKNYSENVNVFVPSVSSDGVLSWTNKAGLANPPAVTLSGGGSNVTVDTTLSATSTNAIANKTVYSALGGKLGKTETAYAATKATQDGAGNVITETYTKKADFDKTIGQLQVAFQEKVDRSDLSDVATSGQYSDLRGKPEYVVQSVNNVRPDENGNVSISVSGGGGVSTSESNTWTAQQNFHDLMLNREKYTTYVVNGASDTPVTSTMVYAVTGAFTLNLATLAGALSASQSSVFTAYFAANADYSLTISNAGKLKYTGSASDVAITTSGLLLNIWMSKDGGGTLTSIVQASKLS